MPEGILITAEKLQDTKQYCSYTLAYFKAHRLIAGNYWIARNYMMWISNKHLKFHKLRGILDHAPYNQEQQADFDEWLDNEAEIKSKDVKI
jgi:hypothetical protein